MNEVLMIKVSEEYDLKVTQLFSEGTPRKI